VSQQDPAGFTTTFGYDAVGNRISIIKPNTAATSFLYDGHRRLIQETNPLSEITQYTYDDNLTDGVGLDASYGDLIGPVGLGGNADGSALRTTNAAGESTVSVRDGLGRETLAINASRNPTRMNHDVVVGGLLETSVTDPLGNTTRRREDAEGRTRTSVDAAGKITTRSFDSMGGLLSERDPNGVGRDCMYDGVGLRTACADTQGDTTLFEHDAAGNQTATTDATGVRTTCTFDFRNRRKSCTNGVGATTTNSYDGNSNLTSVTDGEGRLTTYTYDARNFRLTETFPDSSGPLDKVTRTYDAVGRLATRTDQGGNVMTYTYDLADRLTHKTDAQGQVDSFDYDDVGRFVSGTSQRFGTEVTRGFDAAGRPSGESVTILANEQSYAVSYSYDVADHLTTLTYPDGTTVSRTYTNRDQLSTISLGAQSVAQYTYDDGGRLDTTTFGNGRVESRTYRNDNLLSGISTPSVGDFSYTYDGKKRKLTEGGTAMNGAQTFTYDDEGRPTSWSGGAAAAQSWTLSLEGDWQSTTRNSVTESRTHNAAHELTAIDGNNLSYDGRGNLLQDDRGNNLAWDFENKLIGYAPAQGGGVGYLYDVLGRKVARIEGALTTVFVHAGPEVVAEYDNADLRIKYILGESIDRPVAYVLGGATHWYSANHLGSIAAVSDSTGAVVERYRYDAHGTRSELTPSGQTRLGTAIGNQIGFTGRYHDPSTGLLDFRFRQFDSRLGRFVSRDDEYRDGMSLYFAYFVPNATDPTGHFIGIIQSILGRKKNSQPTSPPVPGVAINITSGIIIACLSINACKDRAGQGLNVVSEWVISDILNSTSGSLGGPSNIDTSGWTSASPNQPQVPPVPVSLPGAMDPQVPNYGGVDSGQIPSSSKIAEVSDAMAKGDRPLAIRLAADAWGITGAANATYNPFISPKRAGNTTPTGTVQIGPSAFVDPLTNMPRSAGFLASTLAHEAVHVHQVNTGNYAQTGTVGEKVNEIEGYDRELRELPRFGMSPTEIQQTRALRNDLYGDVIKDSFYRSRITGDPHSTMNNYLIRSDELYRY
jgi:RHS repeat-associated protein